MMYDGVHTRSVVAIDLNLTNRIATCQTCYMIVYFCTGKKPCVKFDTYFIIGVEI